MPYYTSFVLAVCCEKTVVVKCTFAGSKIKALRNKTNTYIKTPVRGEEPVFVVTGRREDVAAAKREILSASEHFSQIRASRLGAGNASNSCGNVVTGNRAAPVATLPAGDVPGQVTIQVRVPYRVVGLVVGPKGATIKRIQQDSATYIVTPSRDREPVFEVTGTPEGVEKARRDIASYIAQRTGAATAQDAVYPEVSTADPMLGVGSGCPELDARALFGTVLKLGTVPGVNLNNNNNNNNSSAALMTSYNNAVNHLGSNGMSTMDFAGQHLKSHPIAANGSGYDNAGLPTFANSFLRAALEKSLQAPSGVNMNGSGNINDNVIGSMSDSWPVANGCTDQILRSLMSSLFLSADDQSVTGLNSDKCGLLNVVMPSFDDQITNLGHLDALVANCLPQQTATDYCVGLPATPTSVSADPVEAAFQMQQFGACLRGGSGASVDSSLSSVSPTDSTTSLHRGIGQSSSSSTTVTGHLCCMCSEATITSALVPCGHNLFCKDCADVVVSKPEREERRCPVCGEPASLAIRILS